MKNFLIFSLISIFLIGCSKDDELTEIKYNGYGGISSKLNGEVLKPKGGGIFGNTDCRIDQDTNGPVFFSVSYTNTNNNIFKSIRIVALDVPYENMTGQTYNLKSEQNIESFANYNLSIDFDENLYETNSIQNGELKILFHDRQKNIIGGTFWFDAINENGEIIKVTDGRFDLFIN
ncbi:DUF6252 domain-containing protein [Flavobacterium gelidilacus]|uniref:DUF6252 family protein n=1 Tax=Flavobacterium gelidilacus TaxID=206041 RepID=UPI0004008ED3|nr:DUF6252 family protein [Flavobacterium gelidilacus]